MSYRCGPADWIDLAIGRLEDAKRSLRECDRGCDICGELRQARRCLNKALIMVAEEKEIVKEWSEKGEIGTSGSRRPREPCGISKLRLWKTPSRGRLSRASQMGRMSCMHLGFIRLVMLAA